MRKYLLSMLGVASICCLISTPAMASSKQSKKSAKSRSTTTECTTRGTAFTPAYATLIHDGDYPSAGWIQNAATTIVPFTSIQTARNITLDTTTPPYTTFTLPKGLYSINFQFVVQAATSTSLQASVDFLKFTNMYLDLNESASIVYLDWALGHDGSQTMMIGNQTWASIYGSKIFAVGVDNTTVKFIIEREVGTSSIDNFKFSSNLDFYSVVPTNSSIRVNLHKIDCC